MRLIVDLEPADPPFGLALDEAVFDVAREGGQGCVRLWVNHRAVIVGRSQRLESEVDLGRARREGFLVLRRISGGGTVVHYPGNLNVSVITAARTVGSVEMTFARIGGAVARGISALSAPVEASGNRLIASGRKVGGAAQARRGGAVLYHTTVLVAPADLPLDSLLLAHRAEYRPVGVRSRAEATTTLSEILARSISLVEASKAAIGGLAAVFDLEESVLEPQETSRAQRLALEKYGRTEWNASR